MSAVDPAAQASPQATGEPRLLLFGTAVLRTAGAAWPFAAERRHQLLVLLAMHEGEWVPRDQVAGIFWPDRANDEARRNLRKVIFRARDLRGTEALEVTEHALRWPVASDLGDFRRALIEGAADDALDAFAGVLCAGLEGGRSGAFGDWLAAERDRLVTRWREACHARLAANDSAAARAALARRLLLTDPLDEGAVEALLRAELALGQVGQAHKTYAEYAGRLAEALAIEPSSGLRALLSPVAAAPSPPRTTPPHATPAAGAESFIGRRHELAELCALLREGDCRCLTIVGPGGIGKSSLSREALSRLGPAFPGGMSWIELDDLGSAAEAIARLAERIGVDINDAADPVLPLLARLAGPRRLLVLDNAEHLPGLAAVVERLHAGCPSLGMLLTSRERLHVDGEALFPLAGLDVPDEESRDLEAAGPFDAVRLFDARARAALRGFDLSGHLGAVIAIVDAVAGMPLAIELAASWVRLLPPEEIARELQASMDVLERDPHSAVPAARAGHTSLREMIGRSWLQLAPQERQALSALSVCKGGFTRAAAAATAEASLPLLSSLVDKSLVSVDSNGRFGLHPTVASFAADKLAEDAERQAATRSRHAAYFARRMAELAPHAHGDMRLLTSGVAAEFANVRAAWSHATRLGRADLIDEMASAWWRFFENTGRFLEGIATLTPALALPGQGAVAVRGHARVRVGLSALHIVTGALQDGLALAQGGIAAGEGCGDLEAYVGCLSQAGSCMWHMGRHDEAMRYDEQALEVARRHGDRNCTALALGKIAASHAAVGRTDLAIECMQEALAITRETGYRYLQAGLLTNLGGLHCRCGRWQDARDVLERALQASTENGLGIMQLHAEQNLGTALLRLGRVGEARRHLAAVAERSRINGLRNLGFAAERELARTDIADGLTTSALERLRRVAGAARADARALDLLRTVVVYAELLAACGEPRQAQRIWAMALAEGGLDALARADIADRMAAHPADTAAPDALSAGAPSWRLDEVIEQMQKHALSSRTS